MRPLTACKLVYFSFFSSLGCLRPFLPVYLSKQGVPAHEIGLLFALIPFIKVLSTPIVGSFADRNQCHRSTFTCCLIISNALFCLIPVATDWPFPLLLVWMLLANAAASPMNALLDHNVLQLLGEHKSDYGKQRLWGAVGWGLSALCAGALINAPSVPMEALFALYGAGMVATLACVLYLLPFPAAHETLAEHKQLSVYRTLTLICDATAVSFFMLIYIMGCMMGVIATFLFIYLESLGAPSVLWGLSLTVTCVAELPFFWMSGSLIQRLGYDGVLSLALLCYCLRLLYYSFLRQPWLVLPVELLHGVTYAAAWSAGTSFAHAIAPDNAGATVQGILGAVHWGLGMGCGSLVGGLFYESIHQDLFLYCAVAAGCSCVLSLMLKYLPRVRTAPS